MSTRHIAIDHLRERPDNANSMPLDLFDKLVNHIERTGRYPAIIVRPDPAPAHGDIFEILDGHHRVAALRKLGRSSARCDVWEVDDDEALVLLTTLNRLEGRDDVYRRAELVQRMSDRLGADRVSGMLPDSRERIDRLLALARAAPRPAAPPPHGAMPEAVTFFLTGAQRKRLEERMRPVDRPSRSERFVALLRLDED